MKAWREVCVPHADVLSGKFQQSEFAADISAVSKGLAGPEYQDAAAFFARTYITEGMRLLLTQVAQRLNGKGGEPVIQLQTAFGGGKTHTMLAVYHLATRRCAVSELAGVPTLLDSAEVPDVPRAKVAVLDGNAHGPAKAWLRGKTQVRTLWGELAHQLGGDEGFALVKEADETGTSPGKDILRALLERYAPCVVLVDELVAYVRQLDEGKQLSGGSFDSNLSFVQALTEAAKLVPTAVVLASLPESEVEVGSARAHDALRVLGKTFGRVQGLWKPVGTTEGFEIVRRRLFQPITDVGGRDAVCNAFAKTYAEEGARLPSETHEAPYLERMRQAYPIHPEVFRCLFEEWATLEGFQKTRGVLKLMAHVIHRLWKDQNQDLMIMPGSLPLIDARTRSELLAPLPDGWEQVIEQDVDGDQAATTELESMEPRFGTHNAARRVARTLFLGTAPASSDLVVGTRGIRRDRVLLGCVQPDRPAALFSDALDRLCDKLHYLSPSGDKALATTYFWLDTRANLRREMGERKRRFGSAEVQKKLKLVLDKLLPKGGLFDGVHPFQPHADIPDDAALRLVFLPLDAAYTKIEPRTAIDAALAIVQKRGAVARHQGNRLLFLAADTVTVGALDDGLRTWLAWSSIVEDIAAAKLIVDGPRENQAHQEVKLAETVLQRLARDCFRWLLCPVQRKATETKIDVDAFPIPSGGNTSYAAAVEAVCNENELVISGWGSVHLRTLLADFYWDNATPAVRALRVWEDMQKFLYLPRLRSRAVYEQTLRQAEPPAPSSTAPSPPFGTASAQHGDEFEGFAIGSPNVTLTDSLLLIEPSAAAAFAARRDAESAAALAEQADETRNEADAGGATLTKPTVGTAGKRSPTPRPGSTPPAKIKTFHGSVDVDAAGAKMTLRQIADDLIALLAGDPHATVTVTLEIAADFPKGASETMRRSVSENAATLKFKSKVWE